MYDLRGRRAVVCGSSQGIGLAAAQGLAEAGASVVMVARDADRLETAGASLATGEGRHHARVVADFGDPEAVRRGVAQALEDLGPAEILVNNTGGPPAGRLFDADAGAFHRALDMHVVVSQLLTQALVPGMRERGYGRIVNVTSTSVRMPIAGLGVSNTIRAAMHNWVRTMAYELGPDGITVNNVLPGFTNTARLRSLIESRASRSGREDEEVARSMAAGVPLRRFADPEEVAAAIVFLASPQAAYVTGIDLPVDGGRLAAR